MKLSLDARFYGAVMINAAPTAQQIVDIQAWLSSRITGSAVDSDIGATYDAPTIGDYGKPLAARVTATNTLGSVTSTGLSELVAWKRTEFWQNGLVDYALVVTTGFASAHEIIADVDAPFGNALSVWAENGGNGQTRYNMSDIDMVSFTSFAPTVAGRPNPAGILERIRHPWENQTPARPPFDRFTNKRMGEPQYRRDTSKIVSEAAVLSVSNIDPATRDLLRAALVVQAQDTCAALDAGARFNFPQSDGAVHSGRKTPVVLAALLTQDPWLIGWAQRTDWAMEDTYCQYITQAQIDVFGAGVAGVTDGFLPEDLGIPWWFPGPLAPKSTRKPIRKFWRTSYQEMFHVNMVGDHLLSFIVPGYRTMWNNDVVWDYCDRMHLRTQYKDPGSIFAHGLFIGGTNNPSRWIRDTFLSANVVPQWDWPA